MLVYYILNTINSKAYIGKTIRTLDARWKAHLSRANGTSNYHFHNAIRKYGPEVFKLFILATVNTEDKLNQLEKDFIRVFHTYDPQFGYNCKMGGEGGSHTEGTRQKIREAHMGLSPTKETRHKLSKANTGKKLTEDHKRKIRESSIGRVYPPFSEEHKQNISKAKKGKPLSEEHCRKLSIASCARKRNPCSEATRIKIREAQIGKPWSQVRRDAHNKRIRKPISD